MERKYMCIVKSCSRWICAIRSANLCMYAVFKLPFQELTAPQSYIDLIRICARVAYLHPRELHRMTASNMKKLLAADLDLPDVDEESLALHAGGLAHACRICHKSHAVYNGRGLRQHYRKVHRLTAVQASKLAARCSLDVFKRALNPKHTKQKIARSHQPSETEDDGDEDEDRNEDDDGVVYEVQHSPL
eukprot:TRINITY_DN11323_c0_g1_i3.p1 TRINITY_DN11323_c0_g1~~TRINITY_DN11323_c0_g1_i3.p1  ORF type:complete len:189 (+),score=30.36 TRINITY_DN11323_c0_g1_i3:385-951(+)